MCIRRSGVKKGPIDPAMRGRGATRGGDFSELKVSLTKNCPIRRQNVLYISVNLASSRREKNIWGTISSRVGAKKHGEK